MSNTTILITEHPRGRYCNRGEVVNLRCGFRCENLDGDFTAYLYRQSALDKPADIVDQYRLTNGNIRISKNIRVTDDTFGAYYLSVGRDLADGDVNNSGLVESEINAALQDVPANSASRRVMRFLPLQSSRALLRLKDFQGITNWPNVNAQTKQVNVKFETGEADVRLAFQAGGSTTDFSTVVSELFSVQDSVHDPTNKYRRVRFSENSTGNPALVTGVFHTPQLPQAKIAGTTRPPASFLRILKYEIRINVKTRDEKFELKTDRYGDLGGAQIIIYVADRAGEIDPGIEYQRVSIMYEPSAFGSFLADFKNLRSNAMAFYSHETSEIRLAT